MQNIICMKCIIIKKFSEIKCYISEISQISTDLCIQLGVLGSLNSKFKDYRVNSSRLCQFRSLVIYFPFRVSLHAYRGGHFS